MNIVLAVACDDAQVGTDGKLDLHGVYNELSAPGFPAAQERMTVVLVIEWGAEDIGEQPIRADLVAPDGDLVLTIQGHAEVTPTAGSVPAQTRMVLPLTEVVFQQPGRYSFRVTAGSASFDVLPLYVKRAS